MHLYALFRILWSLSLASYPVLFFNNRYFQLLLDCLHERMCQNCCNLCYDQICLLLMYSLLMFTISNNRASDKPHWLRYCHCAKLEPPTSEGKVLTAGWPGKSQTVLDWWKSCNDSTGHSHTAHTLLPLLLTADISIMCLSQ